MSLEQEANRQNQHYDSHRLSDGKNEESKGQVCETDPFGLGPSEKMLRERFFDEIKETSLKEDNQGRSDNLSDQWSCYDEFFREEDRHNMSMRSKETIFCRSEDCDFRKACLH
jgi:hypothetical protein